MKMLKIIRKRRAVSPIIAAILLIGLAVAAAAVLFIIVLPALETAGSLVFDNKIQPIDFTDTDTNGVYDKVSFALKNTALKTIFVEKIEIEYNNGSNWQVASSNATTAFPLTITSGQGDTFTFLFDVLGTPTKYRIKATFKVGETGATETVVSAEYTYS